MSHLTAKLALKTVSAQAAASYALLASAANFI